MFNNINVLVLQQKCTALCYTIAFSLQKNVTEPNKVVEIILAAINEEHSKLSLENYLKVCYRGGLASCEALGQNQMWGPLRYTKTTNWRTQFRA